jgi:hypothetical protein
LGGGGIVSFGFFRRDLPVLPPDVSSVYYHLYSTIEHNTSFTPGQKPVVFCVAYTLYCLEKKDDILGALLKGKARTNDEIAKSFRKYLDDPDLLHDKVSGGVDIASQYAREIAGVALVPLARRIDRALSEQDELRKAEGKFTWLGLRIHFLYAFLTSLSAAILSLLLSHFSTEILALIEKALGGMNHFLSHGG